MKMLESLKKGWENYLKRLAKANKKSFGEGPLDCCAVNKKEHDDAMKHAGNH